MRTPERVPEKAGSQARTCLPESCGVLQLYHTFFTYLIRDNSLYLSRFRERPSVLSFSVVDRRTAVPTTPLNEPRKKQRGNFKPPLRAVAADELDQRREMESDCYHLLTSRRVKQKMIPVWKPAQRMSRKGLIRAPLPGCSVYCRACIPIPLLLMLRRSRGVLTTP